MEIMSDIFPALFNAVLRHGVHCEELLELLQQIGRVCPSALQSSVSVGTLANAFLSFLQSSESSLSVQQMHSYLSALPPQIQNSFFSKILLIIDSDSDWEGIEKHFESLNSFVESNLNLYFVSKSFERTDGQVEEAIVFNIRNLIIFEGEKEEIPKFAIDIALFLRVHWKLQLSFNREGSHADLGLFLLSLSEDSEINISGSQFSDSGEFPSVDCLLKQFLVSEYFSISDYYLLNKLLCYIIYCCFPY